MLRRHRGAFGAVGLFVVGFLIGRFGVHNAYVGHVAVLVALLLVATTMALVVLYLTERARRIVAEEIASDLAKARVRDRRDHEEHICG